MASNGALNGAFYGALFRQDGRHDFGARAPVAIKQHQAVGYRCDDFSLQAVCPGQDEGGDQLRPRRDNGVQLGGVLHPEMGPF